MDTKSKTHEANPQKGFVVQINASENFGLGRWVPANTQVVKDDPFWLHNQDPHVIPYVKENKGPTIPFFEGVHASLESGEFRTTFGNGPCRCHQERHEGV
jgi:hypothetical protein